MITRGLIWMKAHPARAAALAGWLQQICSIGGAAISIPLIIGRLGQETAGLWFSALGLVMMFGITDFGFSPAISRQVAHSFRSDGSTSESASDFFKTSPGWMGVSELYFVSRAIFWRLSILSALMLVVTVEAILPWTHLKTAHVGGGSAVWYLLGVSLLVLLQSRLAVSMLDGLGYGYVTRVIGAGYQLFSSLFSVAVLWIAPSIIALSLSLLAATILQAVMLHTFFHRIAGTNLTRPERMDRTMIGRLWRVALPFGLVSAGGVMVNTVQVPLLGFTLGPAMAAPYYIALRISQSLSGAVSQLTTAQMAFFTQELSAGHAAAARERMRRTVRFSVALHTAAGLFIWLVSPVLVDLWVGRGHYVPPPVLAVIALNHWLTCLAGIFTFFVLAAGRNPFGLTTILHGVLSVAGVLVLCPRVGLIGVPLASLLAGLATNLWFGPMHGWRVWRDLKSRDKASSQI